MLEYLGAAKRRARGFDAAELAAISCGLLRRAPGRAHRRQCRSALHAARTSASDKGFAVIVLESFAYKLAEFIGLAELKAVITTALGDLLPAPRRWLTNFVAKHIG
jgi:hypothetical protein